MYSCYLNLDFDLSILFLFILFINQFLHFQKCIIRDILEMSCDYYHQLVLVWRFPKFLSIFLQHFLLILAPKSTFFKELHGRLKIIQLKLAKPKIFPTMEFGKSFKHISESKPVYQKECPFWTPQIIRSEKLISEWKFRQSNEKYPKCNQPSPRNTWERLKWRN